MKRALITGIRGFTGRYVADELRAHGWEVWGAGSHEECGDARYRRVALEDVSALSSLVAEVCPHAVVHLAAVAFVGYGDAEAFYRINLLGTRNLLTALASTERQLECVLLASSANIYGNVTEGMLDETTPPNPANDYAVSKIAMEYMARLWRTRLPIVITRPFNYTGVGQANNFLLPKIVCHFRERASRIELGNLHVWRDFSDVRAVARAYRRLLEAQPIGETVNICSGRSYSLTDVLRIAETISGHSLRVEVNPAFVRPNEVRTLEGDPSKLRSLIGEWEVPPLEETLRWMIEAAA